jgi:colicin import membrane protein
MASKTLYDILELSLSASSESISAAYERLSAKFPESSAHPDAKLKANAITEAFLTLNNPAKRAQYDRTLAARSQPVIYNVEAIEPFWTPPKIIILLAVIVIFGGAYYQYSKREARLEAERAVVAAKAKEAAEAAKAEEAKEQFALAKQREEALQEERQRRERDMALRQLDFQQRASRVENQVYSRINEQDQRRKAQDELAAQQRQQREEAQAAAATRQRLAQEKAELCRKERERYGRVISC